jgi:hypothetical protein
MKVDWKETFNPRDLYGVLSSALDTAFECGYKFVYWDGKIYDSATDELVGIEDEPNAVYINGVKHTNTGGEK